MGETCIKQFDIVMVGMLLIFAGYIIGLGVVYFGRKEDPQEFLEDEEGEEEYKSEWIDVIFEEIKKERKRQDLKWGKQRDLVPGVWLLILIEELGEASEAFLKGNVLEARQELIQAIAVLTQWLEEAYRRTEENPVRLDKEDGDE